MQEPPRLLLETFFASRGWVLTQRKRNLLNIIRASLLHYNMSSPTLEYEMCRDE